jgi:hypothetical protein
LLFLVKSYPPSVLISAVLDKPKVENWAIFTLQRIVKF